MSETSNATESPRPASRYKRPLIVLALATGALFAAGGAALADDGTGQVELQIVDRSQSVQHSGPGDCPEKSGESGNV